MKKDSDEPPGAPHNSKPLIAFRLTAALSVGLLYFQASAAWAAAKSFPLVKARAFQGVGPALTHVDALDAPALPSLPLSGLQATPLEARAASGQAFLGRTSAVAALQSAPAAPEAASLAEAGREASVEQAAVQAGALFDDADVRGKTLLLVGTRGSRPFILEETVRVANELGLNLMLLDKPENRKNSVGLIPDSHFIAAPIDQRDDATIKGIVMMVSALAQWRALDAVIAFRSHHAQLVGRIVDEVKAIGVPAAPVVTSDNKAKLREKLQAHPELAVPARKIKSADEARAAYRELGGGRFVIKSVHGENSRFVNVDIFNEDDAAAAFTQMDGELRAYAKLAESSDTIFNRYPGIMIERYVGPAPGTHEASVELVMRAGEPVFAMVSDTHGIGKNAELAGGSMTFPSQQPSTVQRSLIEASAKACRAIGLLDGNVRVDVTMTPNGPAIIEINPYLGGAAIWKAVKLVTGVSLIEWGVRAILRLKLPAQPPSEGVVDYRFAASQTTGRILAVEGVQDALATPGVGHVQVLAGPGDHITTATANAFEEWAEVMGIGADLDQARRASIAALARITAQIQPDEGGATATQSADYLQPK